MKTSTESIAAHGIDIGGPFDTAASVAVGLVPAGAGPAVKPACPLPAAAERWSHGLDWSAVLWIMLVHVGALAAPFVFTWKGLVLLLVLSWLTGGLGVCLGYHRLMAHLSFQTYPVVRRLLAL